MSPHIATRSAAELLASIANDVDLVEVSLSFRELANRANAANETLTKAVRTMRARSASWAEIAQALGVTEQAAAERYGKGDRSGD